VNSPIGVHLFSSFNISHQFGYPIVFLFLLFSFVCSYKQNFKKFLRIIRSGKVMYVSPVKKQKKQTHLLVGRDDKRKKFHVIFVVKGIAVEMPPARLWGKIKEIGFDASFGVKAETIIKANDEFRQLISQGYTEEEAPPVI
jgi:hypothetical protein